MLFFEFMKKKKRYPKIASMHPPFFFFFFFFFISGIHRKIHFLMFSQKFIERMIKFRSKRDIPRYLVLFFIAVFSLLAQWSRWLPVYLSTVRPRECGGVGLCAGLSFEPLCSGCDQYDEACILCNTCRTDYESWRYNFQDGVCMTSKQYGLITGFGFSLTFSVFGLIAGFFVDVTSERGSTVLGISALLGGVISLFYR